MGASLTAFSDSDLDSAFPEYAITKPEIGIGASKVAYLVRDAGVPKVLKILREAWEEDPSEFDPTDLSSRFGREISVMTEALSPHLVSMLAAPAVRTIGAQNFVHYLEPHYAGGTLRTRIDNGRLSAPEVVNLGVQLLEASRVLWTELGIVHRDINPRNIVFDDEGRAVLLDLGIVLATRMPDITASSLTSPGTNKYAAPEQYEMRRHSTIDHRTDQFLIGIVLFESLAASHPFFNSPADEVGFMARLTSFERSKLDALDAPRELKDVIARMLSGEQSRRYRTISEPQEILKGLQ